MLVLRAIICFWTSAVLVRAQGSSGGRQYPPCNSGILQGSQYIGCYDLSNEVLQIQISGTDPTLYSYYPGWIENGDPATPALYDNSIDPANCTVACRGHGYKYAALFGGSSCRCMGNAPSTLAPASSTNPLDPATLNSCHVPGQYIPGNCPGDATQFCGSGNYADVYVDNSFPLFSTINPTAEANQYSYIGCFHPGAGNNANQGILSYRVPPASLSGATSQNACFQYCASLGFPFVEFDGGNSYTSCLCGTEVSHGYQQLDSNCKGDCVGGSTCAGGNGCCGQRRSNTIYMNPDLVGCYEAPIPSASFVNGGPVQTYSEPAGGPTMVGHTTTTASYSGPPVVATNPPSVPSFSIRYYNLGCWQRTSASAPIISGALGLIVNDPTTTVTGCLNSCSFLGFSYASLTNETTNGITCRCGNSFGTNNGQQPAASCHQLCPGNAPPQTYQYCGGLAVNEQVFGAQSVSSTTTTTTTSSSSSSSSSSTFQSQTTTTSSSSTSSTTSQTSPSTSSPTSLSTSITTSPSTISTTTSSSATSTSSTASLDCQPDNCLRQFSQSPSVTPFCATYTTAVQTASTGLPPYVSQCQGNPSRVSSACSCVVGNSGQTVTTTTTSTSSSATQTSTTSITSSTTTSSPTQGSSSTSSTATSTGTSTSSSTSSSTSTSTSTTSPTSTFATSTGTTSSSTSQSTTTTNAPPNNNCSPDNCLRQFGQSSAVTPFCQTYTTAVLTDTTGLPSYVSQCQSVPSRISSACSCVVTGNSLPTTSTTTQSTLPANTGTTSSTASSTTSTTAATLTTSILISTTTVTSTISGITTSSTSTATGNTPPNNNNCSPDNCLRQFGQSSAVTPFCQTYTTAVLTDTTGLPSYVSQCNSQPARISSACSCVVTGNPITTTGTTSTTQTTSTTLTLTVTQTTSSTGTTTISTATPTNTPPPQNCSPDNCYRQFGQSSAVTPFCQTYTTAIETDTTGLPNFVSQCNSMPSRISSACSCVVTGNTLPSSTGTTSDTETSLVTTSLTGTTSGTAMSTPTSNPTPPLDCQPDNCLRQFSQSLAEVSTFCPTYTTAVETDTTGLPAFVSQCSNVPSRVSSACSCIVPSTTSSPFTTGSTSVLTTSTTTTQSTSSPVLDCRPDNCLRQFSQSLAEVSTFCSTYTTAIETDTTGLPAFVSQCSSSVSRVSSACSCIVSPPTSLPATTTTSQTVTSPTAPSTTVPTETLTTTATGTEIVSSVNLAPTTPTSVTNTETASSVDSASTTPTLGTNTETASSVDLASTTPTSGTDTETSLPTSPIYTPPATGTDTETFSTTDSVPTTIISGTDTETSLPTPPIYTPPATGTDTETSSVTDTVSNTVTSGTDTETSLATTPTYITQTTGTATEISSITDTVSNTVTSGIDTGTSQPATPTSVATTTGTDTEFFSLTTASSSTSSPTNSPVILLIQPGNAGYYKKRQSYQSFVGPAGVATPNCSVAQVYTLVQGQLFINGQVISTNPGVPYEPLGGAEAGNGTITTTFAIDVNNFLTWQNGNFTNGEAYFCALDLQIIALFAGLSYGDYPPDCQIVSLSQIPAAYCQNGVITIPPTQSPLSPSGATPTSPTGPASGGSTGSASSSPSIIATGSQTGTVPSGGLGINTASLPPNVYPTAGGTPSGLVCITTEYVLTYGAMSNEPAPTTYAR